MNGCSWTLFQMPTYLGLWKIIDKTTRNCIRIGNGKKIWQNNSLLFTIRWLVLIWKSLAWPTFQLSSIHFFFAQQLFQNHFTLICNLRFILNKSAKALEYHFLFYSLSLFLCVFDLLHNFICSIKYFTVFKSLFVCWFDGKLIFVFSFECTKISKLTLVFWFKLMAFSP